MGVTYTIRPATMADIDVVASIVRDATEWLATMDTDQWQYPPNMGRIRQDIDAEEVFIVEHVPTETAVATVTVKETADSDFWRSSDEPSSALYLNRMAVLRSNSGANLGARILDWASRRASRKGKKWLRLDAWRTNQGLQKYYLGQGFELIRIEENPFRKSGVLFQRSVDRNFCAEDSEAL